MIMEDLLYCIKCGSTNDFCCEKCSFCSGTDFLPVPEKYISYISDVVPILNKELKDEFIEEIVKKSPNFDQSAYDRIPEIIAARKHINTILKVEMEELKHVPKCTYCGSTNIKKIGLLNRAISTELWGLGSKKIGKQFHCNKCGADF